MLQSALRVAQRLARPFDRQEVLEEIVDLAPKLLKADRASVLLFDADTNELYAKANSAREEVRFPAETGIAGATLAQRRPIRIDDCYADPRFNRQVDRATGYRTQCLLSLPLIGADEQPVGVMQLLNARRGHFDEEDESLGEMLAGFAALAIQRASDLEHRLRRVQLEADIGLAREIQLKMLPKEIPVVAGYDIASFFQPADETGGDIYDLFPLDPSADGASPVVVLLADATGHGIGAAVSVTQVRSMLRMATRLGADLDSLCQNLNAQLAADLPSNKFVTAFLGILDPRVHALEYHSLAQAPLLHLKAGECQWLGSSAVPMGLLVNPPLLRPEPIRLAPGDLFVVLSDGYYEHENPESEEMGQDRVGRIIEDNSHETAAIILDRLNRALRDFVRGAPQQDDLTALIIQRRA